MYRPYEHGVLDGDSLSYSQYNPHPESSASVGSRVDDIGPFY